MSRHLFKGVRGKAPVDVIFGYDRPLDEYYLYVVRSSDDSRMPWYLRGLALLGRIEWLANSPLRPLLWVPGSFLYDSNKDLDRRSLDIDYFRFQIRRARISVPESMFEVVQEDAARRVGNSIVEHFEDGSAKVIRSDNAS